MISLSASRNRTFFRIQSRWITAFIAGALLFTSEVSAMSEKPCSSLIVSGNPEYPPLLWRDSKNTDHLIGVVPALLKEILEPMGRDAEILHVGTWARVQRLARDGKLDMVAGAFVTKERHEYMDYIRPAIVQLPTSVWVREGDEFLYRHWPDLKGKVGSTLINNSFGQKFDSYAEEYLTIIPVRSITQSFLMAEAGRVDYVLYEQLQGTAKLSRDGKEQRFVALDEPIASEELFFTFPKNSPCNDFDFREKVAERLAEMVQEGRVEELIEIYTDLYTEVH